MVIIMIMMVIKVMIKMKIDDDISFWKEVIIYILKTIAYANFSY